MHRRTDVTLRLDAKAVRVICLQLPSLSPVVLSFASIELLQQERQDPSLSRRSRCAPTLSLSLVLAFAFARCLLARYLLLNCCRWRVDARAVAEAQLDIPAHHHDSARLAYPFHSLSKQGMSRRANGQTRTDKPPATSGQLLAFRVNAQRPLDGSPADKRSGRERSAGRKGGRRSPIIDSLLVCRCSLCRRCSSAKSFSASVRVATCYLRSSSPAISLL